MLRQLCLKPIFAESQYQASLALSEIARSCRIIGKHLAPVSLWFWRLQCQTQRTISAVGVHGQTQQLVGHVVLEQLMDFILGPCGFG